MILLPLMVKMLKQMVMMTMMMIKVLFIVGIGSSPTHLRFATNIIQPRL